MSATAATKTVKTNPASLLSGLKFSTATRPSKTTEARRPNDVVLEFLQDQLDCAKADLNGTEHTVMRTRFVKDEATGRSIKKSISARVRRSYWQDASGEWLASIKYGNIVISLDGTNSSVVCGPKLEDVVRVFEIIKKGVEAGELDAQVAAAAEKARRKNNAA